jgi:ribosomal protein S27AE
MFQKKMRIKTPCPRCQNGSIFRDYEGKYCLQCGYDPLVLSYRRANMAYIQRLEESGLRPPWGDYVGRDRVY